MKRKILKIGSSLLLGLFLPLSLQAETAEPASWHATTLIGVIGQIALFAFIGVILAILGYKLFDLCTPGELHKEIVENKNLGAAIVGAAVILGVCILVAAAMIG